MNCDNLPSIRHVHCCVFYMYLGRRDATLLFDIVTLEREGWGNKCVSLTRMWDLARQGCPAGTWCGHGDSYSCDAASEKQHLTFSTTFLSCKYGRRGRAIPQAGHRPEHSRLASSCHSVLDRRCSCEQSSVLRDPLREHHPRVSVHPEAADCAIG